MKVYKCKIREATKLLFERYLNQFELSEELKNLVLKALEEIHVYPLDKLSRWLGFIQGYVVFTNQTTVEIERNFSRPLFHNAYNAENIKIPHSFSSDCKYKGEKL